MSRFKVLSAVAALLVAGGVATAQSSLTNIFKNLDKVIAAKLAQGGSDTQSLMFSSLGVTYASDSTVANYLASGHRGTRPLISRTFWARMRRPVSGDRLWAASRMGNGGCFSPTWILESKEFL